MRGGAVPLRTPLWERATRVTLKTCGRSPASRRGTAGGVAAAAGGMATQEHAAGLINSSQRVEGSRYTFAAPGFAVFRFEKFSLSRVNTGMGVHTHGRRRLSVLVDVGVPAE